MIDPRSDTVNRHSAAMRDAIERVLEALIDCLAQPRA